MNKLQERQLKTLVKESVQEALNAELFKLHALVMPYVSSREQKEIERLYLKPSRRIAKTYHVKI